MANRDDDMLGRFADESIMSFMSTLLYGNIDLGQPVGRPLAAQTARAQLIGKVGNVSMQTVALPSGNRMPVFGLGTWRMGEHSSKRDVEVEALHHALELGVRLIDTAEMYGEGGAEQLIGDAIAGRRDDLFIVSKVYPHNASRDGVIASCEHSLGRLNTDYINLYLLHWPGSYPLSETFDAFHTLQDSGKIQDFGVSNFDIEDLEDIPEHDKALIGTNQIFYNLAQRQPEWSVVPWCRARDVPVMAYSPLDQGGAFLHSRVLQDIAENHDASPAQIALAWLLHQQETIVIPKSSRPQRITENFAALEIQLGVDELAELDKMYPPPTQPVRLGIR